MLTQRPFQRLQLIGVCAGFAFGALLATTGARADEASNSSAVQALVNPSVPSGATPVAFAPGDPAPTEATPGLPTQPRTAKSFLSGVASKAGDVVVGALNMIGVRYRWGGNTPDSGLDCSGFVRYVFRDTLGMTLPRRAEEMSRVGEKVKMSELKPGDLVFFNTVRQTVSHVGIYIGDNKFIHSPSTGSTVRVDNLDNAYWEKRYTGARRVEVSYTPGQDDMRGRFGRLGAADNY
jgi:cell wall-associated NlpC family hydrolase